MNNAWKWVPSVKNSYMIRILISIYKIKSSIVFYLSTNPCNYDEVLTIIRIKRIKYRFMWVNIQILDAALETLETRKSRSNSWGSHVAGCVANIIITILAMWCIRPIVCTNLPRYPISSLRREFPVKLTAATSYF